MYILCQCYNVVWRASKSRMCTGQLSNSINLASSRLVWVWLTARSAKRPTASYCHFTRARGSKAFLCRRTQQVFEYHFLMLLTDQRTLAYTIGMRVIQTHSCSPPIRDRRWQAAVRQSVISAEEHGNWRAVHLLLNSRGHRGDGNRELQRAEVMEHCYTIRQHHRTIKRKIYNF